MAGGAGCPPPFFPFSQLAAGDKNRGGAGGRSPMAGGAGVSPVFFSPPCGPPQAGRGGPRVVTNKAIGLTLFNNVGLIRPPKP